MSWQKSAAPLQSFIKGYDPGRALGGPEMNGRQSFMNPAVPSPSSNIPNMGFTVPKKGKFLDDPIYVALWRMVHGG